MERYSRLVGQALAFLFLLWSLWFLNFSMRLVFSPILPLVEDEFGVTHAAAGSIFFFQSMGYAVSLFFSGIISGRVGYKRYILISLSVSCAVLLFIPLVRSFSLLYPFSFVQGLSTGMYMPAVLPLITECYSEKTWGRTIAIHDTAASISIFAVPFIALWVLQFMPWRGIFHVMAGAFLVAAAILWRVPHEAYRVRTVQGSIAPLLRNRTLWLLAVVFAFASGANVGLYFVVPLYLTKELLIEIGSANTIFGFSRLGGVVVAVLVGFLVDRFSLRKIMFAMLCLTGILTIVIALAGPWHVSFFLFLQASIATGFFPPSLVAISRLFERESRSAATGLILATGIMFGWGAVPYLLGLSGDLVGFRVGIFALGVVVTATSFLIPFFRKG